MKSFCVAMAAVVFATAALSADKKKETSPAERSAKSSAASAPANAAASSAKVEVTYFPADSPVSENGLLWLKQLNYLELIAEGIESGIRLPTVLNLVGQPCGEANAFYARDEKVIVICYELVNLIVQQADKAKEPGSRRKLPEESRALLALGAVTFVTSHEIGHALIDILDLPVTGREEDVADQIATFLTLHDLKDEDERELALWTVVGGSWFFDMLNKQRGYSSLADEHSLDGQRVYNVACWAYGSDPRRYAALVPWFKGASNRLLGCEAEHAKLNRALTKLIGPSLVPQ
jgi:hypothetical protein